MKSLRECLDLLLVGTASSENAQILVILGLFSDCRLLDDLLFSRFTLSFDLVLFNLTLLLSVSDNCSSRLSSLVVRGLGLLLDDLGLAELIIDGRLFGLLRNAGRLVLLHIRFCRGGSCVLVALLCLFDSRINLSALVVHLLILHIVDDFCSGRLHFSGLLDYLGGVDLSNLRLDNVDILLELATHESLKVLGHAHKRVGSGQYAFIKLLLIFAAFGVSISQLLVPCFDLSVRFIC